MIICIIYQTLFLSDRVTELNQLLERHTIFVDAPQFCVSYQVRCLVSELDRAPKSKIKPNFDIFDPPCKN